MATDDVGCTAKLITMCNNLSWSSVSLCWGKENPREILHRVQVAPLIKSLCPCEYLAGLLQSSGVLFSVARLSNSFLPPPHIFRALPIRYVFALLSSYVTGVLYIDCQGYFFLLGLPSPCSTYVHI